MSVSGGMEAFFCECDYETFDFYRDKKRVDRKEHRCCECGGAIQAGETYLYAVGKYDGFVETFKTCLPCVAIRRDYCAPYTALRETIWEFLGVDYVTGETNASLGDD